MNHIANAIVPFLNNTRSANNTHDVQTDVLINITCLLAILIRIAILSNVSNSYVYAQYSLQLTQSDATSLPATTNDTSNDHTWIVQALEQLKKNRIRQYLL